MQLTDASFPDIIPAIVQLPTCNTESPKNTTLTPGDATLTDHALFPGWKGTLDWAKTVDLSQLDWQGMTYAPDDGMDFGSVKDGGGLPGLGLDNGPIPVTALEASTSVIGAGFFPSNEPDLANGTLAGEHARVHDYVRSLGDCGTLGDGERTADIANKHTIGREGDDLDFFNDDIDAELQDYEAEVEFEAQSFTLDSPPAPSPTLMSSPPLQGSLSSASPGPLPSLPTSFPSTPLAPSQSSSTENACQYKGVTCRCTSDHHCVDPSLPASSPLRVDQSCELMKTLGLSFHRYHRYLICPCGCFIPMGKLIRHYKKAHPDKLREQLTRYANKELLPVIKHFAASLNIPCDQTAIQFTPSTFNGPIAGITKPVKRVTCLACGVTLKNDYVAKRHWHSSCKAASGSTLSSSQRRLEHSAQLPFLIRDAGNKKGTYVMVPDDQLDDAPIPAQSSTSAPGPPAERYVVPDGLDAFRPAWLEALSWLTWRDRQIQAGFTSETLESFAALPPKLYVNPSTKKPKFSAPPTEEEKFSWVASRIQHRLKTMMEHANSFLTLSLRANLTSR